MVKSGTLISILFNRCQEVEMTTPMSNPKRTLILGVTPTSTTHFIQSN